MSDTKHFLNISACINCGKLNNNLQSNYECKYCHKKLDKYFEVNDTLLLIDLFLIKKEVLRHIMFNKKPSLVRCIAYGVLLLISKIFLHEFYNSFDLLKCFVSEVLQFMLYFYILKIYLHLKWKDFLKVLFLSYYWIFNFILKIWNYKGIEYELVVEFIVLHINTTGLSCLCDNTVEDIFMICFVSRIVSKGLIRGLINL